MMGLQATTTAVVAGKRKLESLDVEASPAKSGKWEPPTATSDDCIARLRAVAVPAADAWRAPTPSLAATLLSEDEFDDDEFEDELSDEEKCAGMVPPFDPPRFATPVPQQPYGRLVLVIENFSILLLQQVCCHNNIQILLFQISICRLLAILPTASATNDTVRGKRKIVPGTRCFPADENENEML